MAEKSLEDYRIISVGSHSPNGIGREGQPSSRLWDREVGEPYPWGRAWTEF